MRKQLAELYVVHIRGAQNGFRDILPGAEIVIVIGGDVDLAPCYKRLQRNNKPNRYKLARAFHGARTGASALPESPPVLLQVRITGFGTTFILRCAILGLSLWPE